MHQDPQLRSNKIFSYGILLLIWKLLVKLLCPFRATKGYILSRWWQICRVLLCVLIRRRQTRPPPPPPTPPPPPSQTYLTTCIVWLAGLYPALKQSTQQYTNYQSAIYATHHNLHSILKTCTQPHPPLNKLSTTNLNPSLQLVKQNTVITKFFHIPNTPFTTQLSYTLYLPNYTKMYQLNTLGPASTNGTNL